MAEMEAAPATHFFLGRQPILDRQGDIHGYELLFRSCRENTAYIIDDHHATIQVIARAFSELGLPAVFGDGLGFINLDAKLLTCEIADILPPERIVLEILESTSLTPEAIDCCRILHGKGYRLALDDVTVLDRAHEAVLPYVSYVKVDLLGMAEAQLRQLVAQLSPLKLKLLAEKVETHKQFELCRELGFEFFQGYYFAHPEVLSGRHIDPSHRQMLRLSQLLLGDASDAQIEAVFKEDSKLTYNLLRLVNSVAMGLKTHIHSVHHAIMLLGRRQLQRWLSLLLFAHRDGAKFPDPLSIMAACRGRFMELLAREGGGTQELADQAFMTGMMSLLEAALEIPMARIVEELNLAAPIRAALLAREGRLGKLLYLMECVECLDTHCLNEQLSELGLTLDQLTAAEIAAMSWANAIGKEQ
ncbi:MAG: EAL domain-containing protein [Rhodocyclaceae bacterium]|nr:EAL domain-containing protein [Rhodocyclaceae bacterium]